MLVEHARSLVGIADATHDEYGAGAGTSIISLLACSLVGVEIEIEVTPGSLLERLHGGSGGSGGSGGHPVRRREQTTCNYGLNPELEAIAGQHGMRVAAVDDTGEIRAVERTDHPFFVATLYQPQLSSDPGAAHPVLTGFLDAVGR